MADSGGRTRDAQAMALRGRLSGRRMTLGQAATELALALLFIGVLDLGRAYHTQVAVSNAARVGLLFAQQVASPRMMDCTPGTTCQFISVADVITQTVAEAQGGLDPRQMSVGVCLQHIAACPITDTAIDVASDEAITVSVTVPFTTITPLVHLGAVSGSVSGRTFSFQPVAPTAVASPTPGAAAPTATASPVASATVTDTATPQPTPVMGAPTVTTCDTGCGGLSKTVTVTWSTNQTAAGNTVSIALVGMTNFTPYVASGGTSATLTFTSKSGAGSSYTLLPSGHYSYYVRSATTGGATYYPTCAPASCAATAYPSFYLP